MLSFDVSVLCRDPGNMSQRSGGVFWNICQTKVTVVCEEEKQMWWEEPFPIFCASVRWSIASHIHRPRNEEWNVSQFAEVQRTVGWVWRPRLTPVRAPAPAAAALRLSHVLPHGVAVFGELVGGGGLWRMGARGQSVGDGHPPGHQPLHRSGNPAGGHAHHARGESGRKSAYGESALFLCWFVFQQPKINVTATHEGH